jgi:hypothetical protein
MLKQISDQMRTMEKNNLGLDEVVAKVMNLVVQL